MMAELLVTSGTDGVFPPGLPVGRVQGLRKGGQGLYQRAEVVPAADVTKVEEVLILAIGFSRIYLGVHWPSDVLASYAAGAAWLTVLITVLEISRRFGHHPDAVRPVLRRPAIIALAAALSLSWVFLVVSYYWTHPLQSPALGGWC